MQTPADDSRGRSAAAIAQDERWAELVAKFRNGAPLPFAEQWRRYEEIFAGRAAVDGPPIAWQPSAAVCDRAHLTALMSAVGCDDYASLHRWSVSHRPEFWRQVIERLGIRLATPAEATPPESILDLGQGVAQPRWLPGARLNIVDSCFQAPATATAVVLADETDSEVRRVTYGELEAMVHGVHRGLVAHGFTPGQTIALYMPMTLECVAAYLGIIRAGLVVVSIADSFSPQEVARRLELTGTRVVLTVSHFLRAGKAIDMFAKVLAAGAERAIVVADAAGPPEGMRPGDLLWRDLLTDGAPLPAVVGDPYAPSNVLFSSGTTGDPKVIPWTHLTPIKCGMDAHFHHDVRPGDVVAWPTNIGWMMGPWLIYAALLNRAALALYGGAPIGRDFTDFVAAAEVTMLGVVPALVRAWRAAEVPGFGAWSSVRVLSSTGEPSNRQDYLWLMSRTGYRAPVIEYLGGTEIGGGHVTGSVLQPASPATFSTPALGIDVVILDDDGAPVAPGGEGEMFLVPPAIGLSQSLLNRDHDPIYFADCPAGPHGEVLRRHGDQMARLHHGYFRAQGRADDTMNLGGIKVSSLELERVVNGHPDVFESAAVAVQEEGEGAERLVLFVVVDEAGQDGGAGGDADSGVDSDQQLRELQSELGRRIAAELNPLFKVHDLQVVERLPRTASNKIMRRELRAAYRP